MVNTDFVSYSQQITTETAISLSEQIINSHAT